MITALYDTVTNRWCPDGGDGTARYRRIPVPRNPDEVAEAYSGNDADPIRPATPQESASFILVWPKHVSTRELMGRLTDAEYVAIETIVGRREMARLLADPITDLHNPELIAMFNTIAATVWPDPTVRATRLAAFLA